MGEEKKNVYALKYDAAVAANWLRKCNETGDTANECRDCPFADSTTMFCVDALHFKAAEILEDLAAVATERS